MTKTSLIIGLALASSALACFADLEFAAKTLELKAQPSDQQLEAEFTFKNAGKEEVEVTKVEVGCSCLSGVTDKRVYAPGESGKLAVVFKLGSFTGYQKKGMKVVSGDGKETRLEVGVQIPNVITITPDVAEWFVGDKPEPKSFKVLVEHSEPIKVLEVSCPRGGFAHELKTIKEGREYEIVLTPASTEKAMLGLLRVETDCKIPKHQTQTAFFAISRPKPGADKDKIKK